ARPAFFRGRGCECRILFPDASRDSVRELEDREFARRTHRRRLARKPLDHRRARPRAHLLRATHDAVMVGSGTVLADDPYLTCRLPGMGGRSPVRIVADGSLRVPLTARVAATAREVPTWFLVRHGISGDRRDAFKSCGVEIVDVPATPSGETDLAGALRELGKRGITRLLVEGGATIATA